jgi:hypothetical protein
VASAAGGPAHPRTPGYGLHRACRPATLGRCPPKPLRSCMKFIGLCGGWSQGLKPVLRRAGKYTRGGRVFCIIRICIVFGIVFVFLVPATRDRCGSRKRDGASCLGCTHGTWLCSMSNASIYHVSCYRFVSQHTYIYHIGPHAHVDTDSDSTQQQQPPAPAPAVAQIIQNNTKSSLLYYVLYVLIVLCIVLCIMYFRSLPVRFVTSPRSSRTPCLHSLTHPCMCGVRPICPGPGMVVVSLCARRCSSMPSERARVGCARTSHAARTHRGHSSSNSTQTQRRTGGIGRCAPPHGATSHAN